MKLLLFFLLCNCTLFAQQQDKIHYTNLVEAYYDKDSNNPLYVYDAINGQIMDTLQPIEKENSWYKIAIIDSEYGWFKIKNIQRLPNAYKNYGYENYWVKAVDFLISVNVLSNNHSVYIYDAPTNTSNKVHRLNSYQSVQVIETNDLWVMVSLIVEKKRIDGWLDFKSQCAYPWTMCPKYE